MRLNAITLCLLSCALLLEGCSGHEAPVTAAPATTEAEAVPGGPVNLGPEEVRRLGLEVAPAQAAGYRDQREGYAEVWSHESIAQLVAEVSTAEAATRQSEAALQRIQSLAGTPGAYSADALATGQRKAEADAATLLLARRRLSALLGDHAPRAGSGAALADLASGRLKLVRVTFPGDSGPHESPGSLRLFAMGAAPGEKGSWSGTVWDAPANSSMPGRSVWVVASGAHLAEGERLIARAPVGTAYTGVLIPDAAVVVSEERLWCFVEKPVGIYTRIAIDAQWPVADGYVVRGGVAVGDPVVVKGAGLLLARAMNPATGPEE
jgi:hypothetical protein